MNKIFKIGLDVHGVVTSTPELFSFLSHAIINNGGEVHLLTGGSWSIDLENEVKSYNIAYTKHFSIYDHLLESNTPIIGEVVFSDGTIQKKFDNQYWDHVKGKYCEENQIDLHIDDTLLYNDFFKTPFARFWSHNNKPKATHKDIRHLS